MLNSGYQGNQRKTLKIFLSKTTGQISIYFGTNGPWETLYQTCSNYFDWLKNMAAGGLGLFLLFCFCFYIVRETMHSLIVGRNDRVKKKKRKNDGWEQKMQSV